MVPSSTLPLKFGIRCDALAKLGTGHLVRQTALVEELRARGHEVVLYGQSDVPWAEGLARQVGLSFVPARSDFTAQLLQDRCQVLVIDGYEFGADLGQEAQKAGIFVLAMVDGDFGRHQIADLYVDQNLGSENPRLPHWLVGPDYVLLRDLVIQRRQHQQRNNEVPKILVVFGGSDPFGGCPVAVDLLLRTEQPIHILAIAPNQERRAQLESFSLGDGQSLEVLDAQDDLPGLVVTCDLAVSASGTSVWEFACLGIPTGLVCVTENQVTGYQAATEHIAVPIGHLEQLRNDDEAAQRGITALKKMISDSSLRAQLSANGSQLVDGKGRQRVVAAVEALVSTKRG